MKNKNGGILMLVITVFVINVVLSVYYASAAQAAMINGPRWLMLGDDLQSTVMEQGVLPTADSLTASAIERKARVTIQNLSIGSAGYKYQETIQQLVALSLAAYRAQGVIITLGTHDWGTGQNVSLLDQNVRKLVGQAKAVGLKVVCLTPIHRSNENDRHGPNPGQMSALGNPLITNPANPGVRGYADYIAFACSQSGAQVINGHNAPGLHGSAPFAAYGNDFGLQIHLNANGHDLLATWIVSEMKRLGHWL